jgi:hypothetical protein
MGKYTGSYIAASALTGMCFRHQKSLVTEGINIITLVRAPYLISINNSTDL